MRTILILASVLVGCVFAIPHAESASQPGDRISGVWEFRLLRDPSVASAHAVSGRVAFLPKLNSEPVIMWSNLTDPTHLGIYAADLQPLNVTRELEGPLPHAGAKMLGADSVLIVLNPAPDHGAVVLRGMFRGDSIAGNWLVTSYGAGTHGQFVLWRHTRGR